tara:strand:+ start:167856 stop:168179 length:324 start_codon:yes stop_codon:yes gene_type:complete
MNNTVSKKENTANESKNLTAEVKLIEGRFNKREALNILNDVMDVKINFHKLQRLAKTEGNINDECMFDNSRILELISDKNKTKEFLKAIESEGYNINISSTIHITVE